MKYNPRLKEEIEKFKDYVILVEGKKDVMAMRAAGFERVNAIHKIGIPLRERIEEICRDIGRKDKVCILTDLDKQGKKLHLLVKNTARTRRET